MLTKIYGGIYVLGVVLAVFFVYYANSWLGSIGAPSAALDGYVHYSHFGWAIVLLISLALLIAGTAVLWTTRHAWAIWAAVLYFGIFTVAWYFWLMPKARDFALASGLDPHISTLSPLFGAIYCLAAAAVAYADQFIVVRLAGRMYPEIGPVEEADENPLPQPAIDDEDQKSL